MEDVEKAIGEKKNYTDLNKETKKKFFILFIEMPEGPFQSRISIQEFTKKLFLNDGNDTCIVNSFGLVAASGNHQWFVCFFFFFFFFFFFHF